MAIAANMAVIATAPRIIPELCRFGRGLVSGSISPLFCLAVVLLATFLMDGTNRSIVCRHAGLVSSSWFRFGSLAFRNSVARALTSFLLRLSGSYNGSRMAALFATIVFSTRTVVNSMSSISVAMRFRFGIVSDCRGRLLVLIGFVLWL